MGQPAAKQGDRIIGARHPPDPAAGPSSPGAGAASVQRHPRRRAQRRRHDRRAAGGDGDSTATNTPPHIPIGGTFVDPPNNRATIVTGSATVHINGKPAARAGDTAPTCNDPVDLPVGTVVAAGTGADRRLSGDGDFLGRGWAFPIEPGRDGPASASPAARRRSARASGSCSAPPGRAADAPRFGCGIHDLVFEPNTAAAARPRAGAGARGARALGAAHRRPRRPVESPPDARTRAAHPASTTGSARTTPSTTSCTPSSCKKARSE